MDFVLYGPSGIRAIQVKNTSRVRQEDLRSLKAFREDYPQSRLILLYQGQHRIVTDGILCLPFGEFLLKLSPGQFPE